MLLCPPAWHHMCCLKPHPEAETAVIWAGAAAAGAAAAATGPLHSGKSGGGTRCWVCSEQGQVKLSIPCERKLVLAALGYEQVPV